MPARLRRPVRLLQCPDRASLLHPGGLPQVPVRLAAGAGAGYRRLSGGCPLRLLETGLQAIQLSPYHADPPAHRPVRLGTVTGFLACYFPLSPFGSRVSHQIQRHLLQSLPATRAIQQCASWRTQVAGLLDDPFPGGAARRRDADRPCRVLGDGQGVGLSPAGLAGAGRSRMPGSSQPGNAGTVTMQIRNAAARGRSRHSSESPTRSTPLPPLPGRPAHRGSCGTPSRGSPKPAGGQAP